MNVMVTGAGGFVGRNVMESLQAQGYEPVGVVRRLPEPNVSPGAADEYHYRIGDLRDSDGMQKLVREIRPRYIIHAGAMTPSDEIERAHPVQILEANERSTLALLQAGALVDIERFIFLSSAGVYKHRPGCATPLTESSELNSNGGMYALTKIASERLCEWANRTYNLDVRSVRLGPVYGIHESPTTSRTRMSIAHKAMTLALEGQTIRCNNPEGVYDLIFSLDAASAIVGLLGRSDLHSDVFNLAGPNISVRELLETINTIVEAVEIDWADDDEVNLRIPPLYRRQPLDTALIEAELGYVPRFNLLEGLSTYASWRGMPGR